jgi:lambda family phage portal protein
VTVLKESRMAKTFHEVSLQNAIVQATYAAAIESELPSNLAFGSIGGVEMGETNFVSQSLEMLGAIAAYSRGGKNLEIDGVKIPHLFPGSKLKLLPAGTVGGVGQAFEESLNRYISAGLGISYEEYTHDYSKTNYSSARAAMNNTRRTMMSQKRLVADRASNFVYAGWLEEMLDSGRITSMPRNYPDFYDPFNKAAFCRATWIGSSFGQVDETKETQAAVMRIAAGLSTLEIECARLGNDYREVLEQKAREDKLSKRLGITLSTDATKPGTMNTQRGAEANDEGEEVDEDDEAAAPGNKKNAAFDDGFGDLS